MAKQGGGQQPESDANLFLFGLAIVCLILLFFLWDYAWAYRYALWRSLRIAEVSFFSFFVPDIYWRYFGLPPAEDMLAALRSSASLPGDALRDKSHAFAAKIDQAVAPLLGACLGLPLILLGLWKYRADNRVAHRFDDDNDLLESQSALYPHLRPLVDKRPHRERLHYDPAIPMARQVSAKCINPVDFARLSPPLGLAQGTPPILGADGKFNTKSAEACFAHQCGEAFSGIHDLEGCAKDVFDYLLPKQMLAKVRMLPEIEALLGRPLPDNSSQARTSLYAEVSGDERPLRDVLEDEKYKAALQLREAEIIMSGHAFVLTGLMSMLEEARMGGVVVLHDLRKNLKSNDRRMWYALSSVGRRVAFAEGAGAFAHWLVERSIGAHLPGPLTIPEIGQAVAALRDMLPLEAE